jgi:zinc transporter, ZIP family
LLLDRARSISETTPGETPGGTPSRRALLIGGTVTLHNIPEGLAVGIAFATGAETVAIVLAIAIGIQNLSDGFTVAVAAYDTSLSKRAIFGYTTLTGAVPEPIAAFVGFTLATSIGTLFPVVAAFAAGVIFTVVYTELFPLCRRHGYERSASISFVGGFSVLFLIEYFV